MSLISFNWNNKLLLIFLQSFLLFILNLDSKFKIFQIENNLIENIFNYNLIKSINIFTIFIYLFSIIQSKSRKKKFFLSFQKENNLLIIENRKSISKKLFSKLNLLFLTLILISLDIFKFFGDFVRLKFKLEKYKFELEGFCFLIFIIFSKIILKINFYKHQFFAMFLSIFFSLILIIEFDIKFFIYQFLDFTHLALFMTLIKFFMIRFYFSPYLILFVDGLISFFFCFFIEIYNLIANKKSNFLIFVEDKKFIVFVIFILNFVVNILNNIIIYFFSPIFELLAYDLLSFLLLIKEILIEKNIKILKLISNIIYLICCLIITEILVLNFFGLNKNTVFNINERNKTEFEDFIKEEKISFSLFNNENEKNEIEKKENNENNEKENNEKEINENNENIIQN